MRSVRGFDRARTDRSGVGAGSWFRQTEGGILAVADSGQIFGLLFRSAVQKYALKKQKIYQKNLEICTLLPQDFVPLQRKFFFSNYSKIISV